MAEHPNAELLRQGYEAFARGDLETVASVFDDAIDFHVTGGPLAGTYKGTQERAERDDRVLDANAVHVWHVRGQKAVEFWGIPADAGDFERFWV